MRQAGLGQLSPKTGSKWSDFSFQHRKMNSSVRVLIDRMSLSEGWGLCLVRTDFIMVLVDEALLLLRVLDRKQTHVTRGSPFLFCFFTLGNFAGSFESLP